MFISVMCIYVSVVYVHIHMCVCMHVPHMVFRGQPQVFVFTLHLIEMGLCVVCHCVYQVS